MKCPHCVPGLLASCLVIAAPQSGPAWASQAEGRASRQGEHAISEIVVTAQRRQQSKMLHAGNIERLGPGEIARTGHHHVSELLDRAVAAWIVRGSGQEHQASVRSPVITGGGACGSYLVLEDGIPIRPAGFCNANQLAETVTELADSIEIVRGPGSALHGSNALHGVINVLQPWPGSRGSAGLSLESGASRYFRIRASLPLKNPSPWLASAVFADDGGFREASGYRQGKLHFKRHWDLQDSAFTAAFSATDLDQETAGFIFGKDAYEDSALSRTNPVPEAFRDMQSRRLYGIWTGTVRQRDLDVRPFLRHSKMRFMHHALPGQPVEENGHVSAGAIMAASITRGRTSWVTGVDFEWSDMYLQQFQAGPADGPPPRREVRPQGWHYDYEVTALGAAPFLQVERRHGERFTFGAGLRFEYLHYDYRNLMLDGNTRDDGSECGFGGCLYTRPASRTDSFSRLAPKLSLSYRLPAGGMVYANLLSGYRMPQALELYRLQNGQEVADLDIERASSLEAGWRGGSAYWSADIAAFAMRKRDSVYRDAEGFNVSGAKTRHRGIEASADWQVASRWRVSAHASYARHTYDFSFEPGRGERFIAGRDVDTAPRWLGQAELLFNPTPVLGLGLQWVMVGEYFLDTENRFEYPGHDVFNLRCGWRLGPHYGLALRLNNIADKRYADRADFASGQYRYLPGRGREIFIELKYSPAP